MACTVDRSAVAERYIVQLVQRRQRDQALRSGFSSVPPTVEAHHV